ncbi:MAG: hypothetical protein WDM85_12160 [Caulobacteraceae bacterium]
MADAPALRRLIELPGVADLEFKALMKPAYADPDNRADYPEIDACSKAIFDLTLDEADAAARPADFDEIAHLEPRDQVAPFEAAGWDVTDDKRRPLRMLRQLGPPLWLALHGVAGSLPYAPDDDRPDPWASKLAADAAKFRKR